MPNVHGRGVGDLAVRLTVAVPKKLSSEQKRLVEELGQVLAPPESAERSDDEESGFFFKRKKKKR
jgi:DnaJ-class molecular chaperone